MKLYFLGLEHLNVEKLMDWHSAFSIIPYISTETYEEVKKQKNSIVYETIFSNLFLNGSLLDHQITKNVEESDFLIYPYKLNDGIKNYLDVAKKYNKKIITFYFDDNSTPFNIPPEVVLFRSSINRSLKKDNERCLPYIAPDQKFTNVTPKEKIGFVGRTQHGRLELLESLKKNSDIETDFIYRDGYWHHWADTENKQIISRREYNKNLAECKYHFCYRGHGNFSYRFTEILNFGRIPILVDSDTVLPYNDVIKWDDYIMFINPTEIQDIANIIKTRKYSCEKNRALWEDYFSPCGYFNKFLTEV
jgi:hypothetical protein